MDEVVLRAGQTRDVEAAVATWRRSSTARRGGQAPTDEREAQVRAHLREPRALLVLAEDAGDVVGMAAGVPGLADDGAGPPEPGLFFLSLVYVAPDRWGEGIGGRLVDALMDAARAEGYDHIRLWTHRDNNDRAQRLYEGRGFRWSGVEKSDEAGERIVRYERLLTNAKAEMSERDWRRRMWQPGDQIVLRFTWVGDLSWVEPVTVVEDSPQLIALYLAMDTPMKRPVGDDGLPIPRFQIADRQDGVPLRLGDAQWAGSSVLWLARPGAAHAIGVFWSGEEREFEGWYANLQAPLQRTAIGFDTSDHVLDVDIAPDCTWRWKDEDEFSIVQQRGLISRAEAQAIRAEGERVIAAVEANDWPFNAGWEHWQPNPAWPIPTLPEEWDGSAS